MDGSSFLHAGAQPGAPLPAPIAPFVVRSGAAWPAPALPAMHQRLPKEARTIELPPMPTPVGFRQWRTAVREAGAAAFGNPQAAFAWVQQVEQKGTTFEALVGLLWTQNWLQRSPRLLLVVALKGTAAAQGKLLKGRQLLLKL